VHCEHFAFRLSRLLEAAQLKIENSNAGGAQAAASVISKLAPVPRVCDAMIENPWKNVRPASTAGGIRKAQSRAIRMGCQLQMHSREEQERRRSARLQLQRPSQATGQGDPVITASGRRMHVSCPGSKTIAGVDLRVVRRPEATALSSMAKKAEVRTMPQAGSAAPDRQALRQP
jgi:hypothetical protein